MRERTQSEKRSDLIAKHNIDTVDDRGYYIACNINDVGYLYSDGIIRDYIQKKIEDKAFWPTYDEAKEFYEFWKEDGVHMPGTQTRWGRKGYNPKLGRYNGYTVLFVTNIMHRHERHPMQVIYQGDNGKVWSMSLHEWPNNLVPEEQL